MLMALDEEYTQVMLEQVIAQNELILEVMSPMVEDVATLKRDMAEVKKDVKIHSFILEAHEIDSKDHGTRITALEAAA